MMHIKHLYRLITMLVVVLTLPSCDDVFDTHPYDVDTNGKRNLNAKQIATIEARFGEADTVCVAFISDTHGWYKDTQAEVADLNRRPEVDFVVHCGDLTDVGTIKEFEKSYSLFKRLEHPWVVLIGNHDFLGTGNQIYEVMFGPMDFSFIAGRVKFVCLNTNATEYDYMASIPNFDYMEQEISADSALFDRTVVVMHAPPFSDQFNNNVCKAFRRYLDFFPGLMCCIYGHNHHDRVDELYNDGLIFYGIDCAEHRNYRIFTFTPDGYEMEQIYY